MSQPSLRKRLVDSIAVLRGTKYLHEEKKPTLRERSRVGSRTYSQRSQATFEEMEERVNKPVGPEKIEKLYTLLDGLTLELVEEWVDRLITDVYFEGGSEQDNQAMLDWATKTVNLKEDLRKGIRDTYLAAGMWGELVPNVGMTDIVKIRMLNPKVMEYEKDSKGKTKLDELGEPVGIVRDIPFEKTIWRKDSIEKHNTTYFKSYQGIPTPLDDCRNRIFHIPMFSLSESFIGITPLAASYPDAIRKLNIADATAENAFRSAGIWAEVKEEEFETLSPEELDNIIADLESAEEKSVFVFPDKVKLHTMKLAEMREMHYHLAFFVDAQCRTMGIPSELMTAPIFRAYGRGIDVKKIDFEQKVMMRQIRLADLVNEKIISRVVQFKKLETTPVLRFRTFTPQMKLSESRQIATLYRAGAIMYTLESEIALAKKFGLPTSDLEKERKLLSEGTVSPYLKARMNAFHKTLKRIDLEPTEKEEA